MFTATFTTLYRLLPPHYAHVLPHDYRAVPHPLHQAIQHTTPQQREAALRRVGYNCSVCMAMKC